MMPPVSTTGRVMKIGLSSKDVSLMDMSMIAYWTIRARLLRVPGVANVAIWGERIKMPQVQVDPERMQRYDVSLDEVMETTADALDVGILQFSNGAMIGTGGFIDTPNQRLSIRPVLPIVTPDDLAQVPIDDKKKSDGTPLLLSDVADVRGGYLAAHRRCGHQRRSRTDARRREVPVGQHAGRDTRASKMRSNELRPGPARHRDGLHHLSAGGLHPGGARQSDAGADPRLPARDAGARRLSLRVAHRPDQPGGDPAVAGGRRRWCSTCAGRPSTR